MEGRLGEALESCREVSPSSPWCFCHTTLRVIGPPDLPFPVMSHLRFPQAALPPVFFLLQQFLLAWGCWERKEKQGGDRRKGTISTKGKGGLESAKPKRKALGSKAFCSYFWGQISLLLRTAIPVLVPISLSFGGSGGCVGRWQVWPAWLDVSYSKTMNRVPVSPNSSVLTTRTLSCKSPSFQVELFVFKCIHLSNKG